MTNSKKGYFQKKKKKKKKKYTKGNSTREKEKPEG
jgi:hypothetical protein